MPGLTISELQALTGLSLSDLLTVIDVSDSSMASAGTSKKVTLQALRDFIVPAGVYQSGGTDVAVADGGTGASSASVARSNLGAAASADLDAVTAAWATWTPTWTNLTLGNGSVVAKYKQIGKLVIARLALTFGSTSSIAAGGVEFTLPVNAAEVASQALGNAIIVDTGTTEFIGIVMRSLATAARGVVRVMDASATYAKPAAITSAAPMTWANTDVLLCKLAYESV